VSRDPSEEIRSMYCTHRSHRQNTNVCNSFPTLLLHTCFPLGMQRNVEQLCFTILFVYIYIYIRYIDTHSDPPARRHPLLCLLLRVSR
jgi:hypothetical protein